MAHSIHEEAALRATDKSGFSEAMQSEQHIRMHVQKFLLYPQFWNEIPKLCQLDWKEYKFSKDNSKNIEGEKGVYAFVIRAEGNMVPPSGYIAYIGKASDLKTRYKQYVDEKKYKSKNHRYHIHRMLTLWSKNVYFTYATVDKDVDEEIVESALINGLHPPYNRSDFKGKLSKIAKEAFQ